MSQNNQFDFIVVGGGTAGPAAARRLAEYCPNDRVLLVEAGPRHESIVFSTMAMGWEGLHHTDHDWRYTSQPMANANNRQIHLPRGKFLGGSSGVNGTLMLRGVRNDYDRLAGMGIEGWSWDDVLPFFKKSETFHPTKEMKGDLSVHGKDGPLHTSHHPLAPISERLVKSFMEKGIPWNEDMFSNGTNFGIGHVPRTVFEGVRTTGADFVVGPTTPNNLTVVVNHQCTRVILTTDENGEKVATGIEVRDNATGFPATYTANKEIVLSCGAYNTPQLLMLSGIGPKMHLEKFRVPVEVALEGVGQNLQDHIINFNFFQVTEPRLTTDYLLYPDGAFNKSLGEWMTDKGGILGRFPFGAFVFKRFDEELKAYPEWNEALKKSNGKDPMGAEKGMPHVEYFTTECYGGGPQHVDKPVGDESAFAMISMLFNPQSRGSVTLQSKNPLFPPRIDHNYLDNELDLVMLAEANRFGAEVVTKGAGTKDIVAGPWPVGRTLPTDTEGWKEYVREQSGTCYHAAGTCAMGPTSKSSATLPHGAVVDDRLRVFGVKNLRVADVSVLPLVNTGHTQAPAYMVGEKAAFMIAQDADILQDMELPPKTTKVHLEDVGTEGVHNEQQHQEGRL